MIPVTEAERREKFFEEIKDDHPLMDLIHRCINNDPHLRPHASEIVKQVSQVATQFPATFANRLIMLRIIEEAVKEIRVLQEEKDVIIQQNEVQIMTLQQETKQKAREIERLNVAYSSEVEQLKLEFGDLNSQTELLVARHNAEVTEYKAELAEYKSKIAISERKYNNTENILQKEKELSGTLAENLQKKDVIIAGMKEQLTKAREYLTTKQQVSSHRHPLVYIHNYSNGKHS